MKIIHRAGLDGKAFCGESGVISSSGILAFITCPKCKESFKPIDPEKLLETFFILGQQFHKGE